ncbi:SRPBCC family protein [Sorangium sp. So ce887]|uniref:SRPBCC family protein n=1 Tax=Sorangium sp. So ce887 TaxID=3133324 RepID=UPI003F60E270
MATASFLLAVICLLGAFDIAYFHWYRCRLGDRAESRVEVWLHVARGFIYALQLALVPNVQFHGVFYAVFVALFVADIGVAMADIAVEPASRRSQGGLPGGEYLMHIVLSVLVGAYLHAIAMGSLAWRHLPSAVVYAPADVPGWLRGLLGLMGAGAALVAVVEGLALVEQRLPRPAPIHVRVRLRTTVERLWEVTQDHRLHPSWDHRFSRISMLGEVIQTGTAMRYEKDLLGVTIRGGGRYKLHRPCRQSTFEFWSEDRRSLIRRGVGLWLYRAVGEGVVEFSTSYTYEVRWGGIGRWIDRAVFRPLFQRATERSFRRLAERYFPEGASRVAGARGRKPVLFLDGGDLAPSSGASASKPCAGPGARQRERDVRERVPRGAELPHHDGAEGGESDAQETEGERVAHRASRSELGRDVAAGGVERDAVGEREHEQ